MLPAPHIRSIPGKPVQEELDIIARPNRTSNSLEKMDI